MASDLDLFSALGGTRIPNLLIRSHIAVNGVLACGFARQRGAKRGKLDAIHRSLHLTQNRMTTGRRVRAGPALGGCCSSEMCTGLGGAVPRLPGVGGALAPGFAGMQSRNGHERVTPSCVPKVSHDFGRTRER